MPTRSEIQRMFSRGPAPRRDSRPAPAAAPPAATLPPLPPGYAYVYDPAHGYVPVQTALPGGPPPAARRVLAPNGQPAHHAGPASTRSAQLLRPGTFQGQVVDKYQELLARTRDLEPTSERAQLFAELVPDPSIMEGYAPPRALHENTAAAEDPHVDAWGASKPHLRIVGIADGSGEAPPDGT